MSDARDLLKRGRPVYVDNGSVGMIVEYDDVMDMWLVSVLGGELRAYPEERLRPLFTLDQVVSVKVEEDTTPALVKAVIPFGMSSDDLAHAVANELAECVGRIKGVGNDHYNEGGHQKFEELDLDELFQYMHEEIQDVANYAVFLMIRLRRIQEALRERDDLGVGTEEEFEQTDYSVEDFQEEDNES